MSPLIAAAGSGNVEVVAALLRDHGADVRSQTIRPFAALGMGAGCSALYLAVSVCPCSNQREIIQVL